MTVLDNGDALCVFCDWTGPPRKDGMVPKHGVTTAKGNYVWYTSAKDDVRLTGIPAERSNAARAAERYEAKQYRGAKIRCRGSERDPWQWSLGMDFYGAIERAPSRRFKGREKTEKAVLREMFPENADPTPWYAMAKITLTECAWQNVYRTPLELASGSYPATLSRAWDHRDLWENVAKQEKVEQCRKERAKRAPADLTN